MLKLCIFALFHSILSVKLQRFNKFSHSLNRKDSTNWEHISVFLRGNVLKHVLVVFFSHKNSEEERDFFRFTSGRIRK